MVDRYRPDNGWGIESPELVEMVAAAFSDSPEDESLALGHAARLRGTDMADRCAREGCTHTSAHHFARVDRCDVIACGCPAFMVAAPEPGGVGSVEVKPYRARTVLIGLRATVDGDEALTILGQLREVLPQGVEVVIVDGSVAVL